MSRVNPALSFPILLFESDGYYQRVDQPAICQDFATASELYDRWLPTDGPELLYAILESLDLSDEFPELVYFSPVGFLGTFRRGAPLRNRLRVRLEELSAMVTAL